jgi:hypothetical protein
MTIIEQILTVANKLADQGKKPTVALVKTRLSQPVPLPTIISVLKTFQHQPDYSPSVQVDKKTLVQTDEQITLSKQELIQLINQALDPIKKELNEIKSLLKNN